jgi:hypothetical protein
MKRMSPTSQQTGGSLGIYSGAHPQDTIKWGTYPPEPEITCPNPKCQHDYYCLPIRSEESIDEHNAKVEAKAKQAKLEWKHKGGKGNKPQSGKKIANTIACYCIKFHSNGNPNGTGCPACEFLVSMGGTADSSTCEICNCRCGCSWERGKEYEIKFSLTVQEGRIGLSKEAPALDKFTQQISAFHGNAQIQACNFGIVAGRGKSADNIHRDTMAIMASSIMTDPTLNSDFATRKALQEQLGAAGSGKYGTNTTAGVDIQYCFNEESRSVLCIFKCSFPC